MHLFEFALRDFMNVERFSRATTVIVMDDMLPRRHVERRSAAGNPDGWTGDVFKVALVLRELPPGPHAHPGRHRSDRRHGRHRRGPDEHDPGTNATTGSSSSGSQADPQTVPDDILERRHAVDPERLLAADIWSTLRGARHGSGGTEAAKVRAAVDAIRPAV